MKMNDEPINHLCRVLGRLEMRREVDLVKTESQRERERGKGVGSKAGELERFQCN